MEYYVVYQIWGDLNIPLYPMGKNTVYFAGKKHEQVYWNITMTRFNEIQTANPIEINDVLDFDYKSSLIHFLFDNQRVEDMLREV